MDIGIHIEVLDSELDFIQVRLSAWNGSFGGMSKIYLHIGELEEIAARLAGFPISVSDNREITLGSFGPNSSGGASLRFYCVDPAGHTLVESRIESGHLIAESIESVTLSMSIEPAALDLFVDELRRVGMNSTGKANLVGMPPTILW